MSLHGSEDEFETSLSESPRVKSESNPNPFQGAIGSIFPSFTGRVTRSRSSATPPLQNPNYDFPTEVESALQTTAAMLTAASAPPVQNLGRVGESLFSRNILTEETETRVSIGDLTRMIDIAPRRTLRSNFIEHSRRFSPVCLKTIKMCWRGRNR